MGLGAAALFGLTAPLSKPLLEETGPLVLAALLYLGGGIGLLVFGGARRILALHGSKEAALRRSDVPLLLGVVLTGGIVGPVLMLTGLERLSALGTSLLLNLEAPFTIVMALLVFREHLGRRELVGAAAIVGGALLLAIRPGELRGDWIGVAALSGACLAWATDNNLTQRLSLRDPVAVVVVKTLGAGGCMLAIALALGQRLPPAETTFVALLLGSAGYGLSIVLDLRALRILGAAREAAYFATAPFLGALASVVLLGDRLAPADWAGGAAMALGVWTLLRARHAHVHTHEALVHEHLHVHDEHHRHHHEGPVNEPHSHEHRHVPITHDHPHLSDLHHRHRHGPLRR